MSARLRHRDSIGDLCVALAHRWEPERLFVIFTAYFDESGTHEREPTVILSAFVGHAYQWRRFEKKLPRIQKKYGFELFHAKDFWERQGEFSGWSGEKCRGLIRELTELVKSDLCEGLTISLDRKLYMEEYRADPVPKGMSLDSQYGVCFRACLGRLIARMELRGNRDRLHVVMEGGHKNVGDCDRIFHIFKREWDRQDVPIFGTFTTAGKDCAPLMVADMLAFAHGLANAKAEGGELRVPPQYVLPAPTQRAGVLVFLSLQEGALQGLKDGWAELTRLRIENWRAARDARRAASAGPG